MYKKAVERLSKRLKNYQSNVNFLIKFRDVYPTFVKWKNTRYLDEKQKKKLFRRNLLNEISLKYRTIRKIQNDLKQNQNDCFPGLTWLKRQAICYSIQCSVNCFIKPIDKKLVSKLDTLIKVRDQINGVTGNPNTIVTNLSSFELSNDEYSLLRFGLSHGLATRPKEMETFALAEDIWSQLYRSNVLKQDVRSIERAKRAFASKLFDIEDRQIFKDDKKIKMIQKLRKKVAILKPDKSNGFVIIDIADYDYEASMIMKTNSEKSTKIQHTQG